MNIIIFHHFDYPEGMATTKRFQFFAEFFQKKGCKVTFILKTNQVKGKDFEKGEHKGLAYYKIFLQKKRRHPFYYEKEQHKKTLEIFADKYIKGERNIISATVHYRFQTNAGSEL